MKIINLERYKKNNISFYLALEEYLSSNYDMEIFFIWDINKAIIVGKHQVISQEVNEEYAFGNNIPIYRRPSGGGSIFADEGDFMFSFISKSKESLDFKRYLQLIIDALNKVGIPAYFSGRNDLLIDNKKFSGNAYYKLNDKWIIHGTFMYDVDVDKLDKVLKKSDDKIKSKGIKSISQRVINIKDYTKLSQKEIQNYLLNSISDESIELKEEEINKVKELERKFDSDEYINNKNPFYNVNVSKHFSYGNVSLSIAVEKGIIKAFSITGDFFTKKDLNNLINLFYHLPYNYKSVKILLDKNNINNYIIDACNDDLLTLMF